MFKSFASLEAEVKKGGAPRIAVAVAEDEEVLVALEKARSKGLTGAVLTGRRSRIRAVMKKHRIEEDAYEIIDTETETDAVKKAVMLVRDGRAQVLMKGLCTTASFLRGVLDKAEGLRSGNVLSHLAVFESPAYHKIFMMSDAAMNIAPDLAAKIAITENAISAAHRLGNKNPKVAVISAVEKVNPEGIPSSVDAAVIAKMGDRHQITGAVIDGPLAVDNAFSSEACQVKGLESRVGGDADICIVPNIETGNVFYKLLTILGNAKVAGIIVGAAAPIVLTSRADSDQSKYLSILTALKAS
jgi:phosphate butyryltransferase